MGEHWLLFLFLAGLVAAWSLIILGVLRSMLTRNAEILEARIEEVKRISEQNQGLERQFLELKADLPLNYVRKEDFIRHEVVINTKLDRLRDLIEDLKKERTNGK
jgi:hypothetical protein